MKHEEKVAQYLADFAARNNGKKAIVPPLYRLAWKLGINIPPPNCLGFWPQAFVTGIYFATVWGLVMWFWVWRRQGYPVLAAFIASLAAGFLFGVSMACLNRWKAKKLNLPAWSDYEKKG